MDKIYHPIEMDEFVNVLLSLNADFSRRVVSISLDLTLFSPILSSSHLHILNILFTLSLLPNVGLLVLLPPPSSVSRSPFSTYLRSSCPAHRSLL